MSHASVATATETRATLSKKSAADLRWFFNESASELGLRSAQIDRDRDHESRSEASDAAYRRAEAAVRYGAISRRLQELERPHAAVLHAQFADAQVASRLADFGTLVKLIRCCRAPLQACKRLGVAEHEADALIAAALRSRLGDGNQFGGALRAMLQQTQLEAAALLSAASEAFENSAGAS